MCFPVWFRTLEPFPRDSSLPYFARSGKETASSSKSVHRQREPQRFDDFPMSGASSAQPAPPEEKKETRPWNPEEKQLFYKGFSKYYKKFQQISEMVWNSVLVALSRRSRRGVSRR